MRLRRTAMGFSQKKLGEALGLTYQQVQKYERGITHISARQLLEIARLLEVPIAFFYGVSPSQPEGDPLSQPEAADLAAAWRAISDPVVRRLLFDLANAIATGGHTSGALQAKDRDLSSALSLLLTVVDLADQDGGVDNEQYMAAKLNARSALADRAH
jgi:transcriptional regulator with XRE-family HTH domain